MNPETALPNLLLWAWLLPLASFAVISIGYSVPQLVGLRVSYATQKFAAYIAIAAIVGGFVLSSIALVRVWIPNYWSSGAGHHAEEHAEDHAAVDSHSPFRFAALQVEDGEATESDAAHDQGPPKYLTGNWYTLAKIGSLELTIGYYIDALTVAMFCMVTLIASCVHIYAYGYMHDELHEFVDHEVTLEDGHHLHRRGRFHRFFQYLSLFSFSMLGICVAGNLAMVFVFWELVGICSYFLIGFYIERHSASTAANKAFIVNRVGDFGMLIGLMAIWTTLGTFNFGDMSQADGTARPGIFSLLRTEANHYELAPADGMVAFEARQEIGQAVSQLGADADATAVENTIAERVDALRGAEGGTWGQWLLFIAGVGIFCGCMGKSAQFPLHTWLPDAMEGPTPVSALVHSATMVAAGVFLVGRVFPIFTPEALLVIATIGLITLVLAATIAVTAVDIKRVLAYSTVSQLGFMMLALGLGGWLAGLFHLITHAFFKSLLFLCSGSVIHAVHTNDMRQMGGLRHKMPITAYTMLIGCLAIAGVGIPFWFGFSGFHSKDLIVEQALNFVFSNDQRWYMWLYVVLPLAGALLTSFYMFRLWYMTFAGTPRDHHRYDHAHESPWVMAGPLVLLAVFAVCIGWPFLGVEKMLEQGRPLGVLGNKTGALLSELVIPDEHASHADEIRVPAGWSAILVALAGIAGATVVYLWELISKETLRQYLSYLYHLTWNKWWFDELYDFVFVRPSLWISERVAGFDRRVIDGVIDALAWINRKFAVALAFVGDRLIIDNFVDTMAEKMWNLGLSLRGLQTGRIRQYVMFIVVGTIVLFAVASVWRFAIAG